MKLIITQNRVLYVSKISSNFVSAIKRVKEK